MRMFSEATRQAAGKAAEILWNTGDHSRALTHDMNLHNALSMMGWGTEENEERKVPFNHTFSKEEGKNAWDTQHVFIALAFIETEPNEPWSKEGKKCLYVVEILENDEWVPTVGVSFTKKAAIDEIKQWRQDHPNERFRIKQYWSH